MSDFSSDGMSEIDSEIEELERTLAEKKATLNRMREVDRVRVRKKNGDSSENLGIKSLDEIVKEKALNSMREDTTEIDIRDEDEEFEDEPSAVVEAKPRKIKLGGKRKVTLAEPETSPPKIKIKTLTEIQQEKTNVRRRVQVCTEDTEESEDTDRIEVTTKPAAQTVKMGVTRKLPKEKGERRAPKVQLYRPPALKDKEVRAPSLSTRKTVDSTSATQLLEEQEAPSVRRKNKNWGVKTFSEILREKQLKKEQKSDSDSLEGKVPLGPLLCDQSVLEETVSTKKKSVISPIKFSSDDVDGGSGSHGDAKEVFFKMTGFTQKKRSLSPENDQKQTEIVLEDNSSQSQSTASKKVKRSNVWSTRAGQSDHKAGQGQTEPLSGSRKLSIQRRHGKVNTSAEREERTAESSVVSSTNANISVDSGKVQMLFGKAGIDVKSKEEPADSKVSSTKMSSKPSVPSSAQMLFGKPRLDIPSKERPLFGKTSTTAGVQEEKMEKQHLGSHQPKKSVRGESAKPELTDWQLKPPLSSMSAKPVRKPSTPKVVTPSTRRRSSASSTKETFKSTSGLDSDLLSTENEESLNLEDTLEDELVQLLGGEVSKDMVTSSNDIEVDPDEDLLKEMEELLG